MREATARTTEAVFLDTVGELRPLLTDENVTEIMVNKENDVWVERCGVIERIDINLSTVRIRSAIQALAAYEGKNAQANSSKAILDARFGNLRIAGVLAPTAVDGNAMCIRRHARSEMLLSDYTKNGFFEVSHAVDDTPRGLARDNFEEVAAFLRKLVIERKNILVAGGTASGKTTFLNAMIAEIPERERVVSIEDTVELNVRTPNRVRLLANKDIGITTRDLLKLSLRLRPDRIIVGEVRGEEAYDLLQALNTGHDGGFATVHANSASLALTRIEALALQDESAKVSHDAIKLHIASCINYVVFLKKVDGKRRLAEILEIKGFANGQYLFNRCFP